MMKTLALVVCGGLWGSTFAYASDAPAQPAATVQKFLDSFNAGDIDAAESTHSSNVVIVDEFAPFQWQGYGAFRAWVDALTRHDSAAGVTDGHMATSGTIREEVSGDRAYLVLSTEYTFKDEGVAMRAPAQMTFALRKEAGGWRISAWTYSAARASPVDAGAD